MAILYMTRNQWQKANLTVDIIMYLVIVADAIENVVDQFASRRHLGSSGKLSRSNFDKRLGHVPVLA
jgi:hypothetical protein